MRADRLLSELMLLQVRGKMSAAELAREMEVTERTIYRDMVALSVSGIPIYAEQGAGGGYQLIDGYRTQLTGLNDHELRALFAVNIPALLGALGMDESLNSAMRKLQASIPAGRENQGVWVQQRFYLDSAPWQDRDYSEVKNHLTLLQDAVWNDRKVRMEIDLAPFGTLAGLELDPYALVIKDNRWYLICHREGNFSVKELREIRRIEVLEDQFQRAANFDLFSFWQEWLGIMRDSCRRYPVIIRVNTRYWRDVLHHLRFAFAHALDEETDGWREVILHFDSLHDARNQLIQLGGSVQVLTPEPLRLSLVDFAAQISTLYQD